MPTMTTFGRRLGGLPILLALVGCGETNPADNLPRKAVAGIVSLDGQPLARGLIQFEPVERTQGTTLASADIADGRYSIDRAKGPVPGKYKVSISSRAPIKISPGEAPGPLPKPEPEKVPAQFNTRSDLTKDVTAESENKIDFDLKSS